MLSRMLATAICYFNVGWANGGLLRISIVDELKVHKVRSSKILRTSRVKNSGYELMNEYFHNAKF